MKKLFMILMLMGAVSIASAQVAGYSFSQATSTYTEITGGTVLGDTTIDEQRFVDPAVPLGGTALTGPGLPIGFNFVYNGNTYDVFAVNTNAWISFGQSTLTPNPVDMTSTTYTTPISTASTALAILQNRLSLFGRNIAGQLGSSLQYLTTGTAPNRVLTIQWKHFRRNAQRGEDFNFQIKLYETTNVVEFVYGAVTVNAGNATAPQIGLRGAANTDYNNRTSTTNWSATTAGAVNTASVTISTTVFPTPGLIYHWAPPLAKDAGVIAINSPGAAISAGLQNIAVTLQDFGTDTLKNVTIGWSVNGATQTPHAWTGLVAHNATNGPDTIGTYTFVSGTYIIKAWTHNPNGTADLNNVNDTTTKSVFVQGYAAIPFYEGFDSTWINKQNTRDVPSLYWLNTPATGNNSWRRNDDTLSAAWSNSAGGANGHYAPPGANGTIHSARFHSWDATAGQTGTMDVYLNFTTAGTKMLKFWYINPTGTDSLALYISTNGGTTFTYLQKFTTAAAWTQYIVNLGSSASATTILRFKTTSDYGNDDIGLDGVQVYLQPANEMAAYQWVTPVSGCGLTNATTVTVKAINMGTAAQSNIPVYFSIDGGATHVGPEHIPGPVNPGDTVTYTFTGTANFSNPGTYHCTFLVKLAGDQNLANDTAFATVVAIGTINTFPFTEDFNTGSSNYFLLNAAANAGTSFLDSLGVNNTGCAFFTGFASNTGWAGTGTISAAAAYGTYTSHLSTLKPCSVDATSLTGLRMKFDLKQMYYTQRTYTWMCVVANGTDTLADLNGVKYYNPTTTNADPFTTRTFDLSAYAGTQFTLEFASACKYNVTAGTPGNNNYIDNIMLWVPVTKDAGVTSILSPKSSACGNSHDSLVVIVKNYGLDTLTNIPVTGDITAPSGAHLILNNTLAGPLAPNATDTLVVGYGSTVGIGTYNVTAYTHLTGDPITSNDSAYYTFNTYTPLAIPHLENFQSGTPLTNWNVTNFLSGAGHGNASTVMYATMSTAAPTAKALMNNVKVGTVTTRSFLTFDYRIVSSPNGTTGTNLTTDSIFVLVSGNCGATYDTIHIIDAGNHTTSTTMKHISLPLLTYAGSDVMPGFYIKRGTAGTYFVDIDNVAISDAALVNLGPDVSLCPGGNTTFDAGASAVGYTYTYNWNTLAHPASIATTQTITVDSAATYIAAVNNGYGVITTDTAIVTLKPVPVVDLGPDVTKCGSDLLDAGAGFASYLWSSGATTQTYNVTATGNYWVEVSNAQGCSTKDSVIITITPLPTVYAGPAQSICYLDTLNIAGATAADYSTLLWTGNGDGHFINNATSLTPGYVLGTNDISTGQVTLTLTAYAFCDTVTSSFVLTITNTASANAGSDQTICSGSTAQLLATGGTTFAWSPSATLSDATIANPIANPTTTTTYIVTVTSSCGSATDNVTITVDHITPVNLGADTTTCLSSINLNAGSGYDSYTWSNGATTQLATIDTTGVGYGTHTYWVEVTKGVCTSTDTIKVTFTNCIGIVEFNSNQSIKVYPNPNSGIATIEVHGFGTDTYLSIYSLQGQSVYTAQISGESTVPVDLSNLPKGVYVIRINNGNNSIISKMIIQ